VLGGVAASDGGQNQLDTLRLIVRDRSVQRSHIPVGFRQRLLLEEYRLVLRQQVRSLNDVCRENASRKFCKPNNTPWPK